MLGFKFEVEAMKAIALVLLLLVPLHPAYGNSSEAELLMTLRIDGEIEVSKEGRVISHRVDTKLVEGLREPVNAAIARWTFVPLALADASTTLRSPMRITLVARPFGKDYSVVVDSVDFEAAQAKVERAAKGDVVLVSTHPKPRSLPYPVRAVVTMTLGLDRSGRILDVVPRRCSIHALSPPFEPARACAKLEANSIRAMKQWSVKYEPKEGRLDAEPISATVALHFIPSGKDKIENSPGNWRNEWRTPSRPAPWSQESARSSASDPTDGAILREIPNLKLRPGIIGHAL